MERGRSFSKREVRVVPRGPYGIFFTRDATGSLVVWSWLPKPDGEAS
ncbi:hypothetical protein QQP08_005199 [Theobroma cacao]|nr:hypothetical protein QQP08_005199 [Theobroma cacao]